MKEAALRKRIEEISWNAGFEATAVAVRDHETGARFSLEGTRKFHAASTIKAAILLALFKGEKEGTVKLDDRLHIRNRFLSLVDGVPFRLDAGRDADPDIYKRVGRTLRISELAKAMITRSSNLATNLLMDYIGLKAVQQFLDETGIEGVIVRRGVEDMRAADRGLVNETTAEGLASLFSLVCEERFFEAAVRERILEILLAQEHNSMIPALLPERTRVAHKTGEISTGCHDAGIVFPPDRKPYVVAILTSGPPALEHRQQAVAAISKEIYDWVGKGCLA